MGYAEIHFHLLPGIDDGPSSIEESVALAAAAAADGTRTIVATPHVHPRFVTDTGVLADRLRELRAALAGAGIEIDLLCGGELSHPMVDRLSDAELDVIAHGPLGRRWLLLEAPLRGVDHEYTVAADELRERGFGVVMAHPERALDSGEAAWRAIEHELEAGSALQINAWSVAGVYGEGIRTAALRLLRRAPQAAIASDAHGGARMPALEQALDALAKAGVADPRRLVTTAPQDLFTYGVAVGRHALAA